MGSRRSEITDSPVRGILELTDIFNEQPLSNLSLVTGKILKSGHGEDSGDRGFASFFHGELQEIRLLNEGRSFFLRT